MSFCWGRSELEYKIKSKDSDFDTQLLTGAGKLIKMGKFFRTSPVTIRRRRLEGVLGIIVQNAVELFTTAREVGKPGQQVLAEREPDAFTFAMADEREKVLAVELTLEGRFRSVPVTVFASVSPLCKCHVKVVPKCDSLLPQHLSEDMLLYGLCLLDKSTRTDFRLIFDSLATRAVTNHFHYDGMYLASTGLANGRFPIENTPRAVIAGEICPGGVAIELLQEVSWYARGFVVSAGGRKEDKELFPKGDNEPLARVAARVVEELQRRNIPHTVLLAPPHEPRVPKKVNFEAAVTGQIEGMQFPQTNEIYIVPRPYQEDSPLGVEVAGLVLAKTEELYSSVNEAALKEHFVSNVQCKGKLFDDLLCKVAWMAI